MRHHQRAEDATVVGFAGLALYGHLRGLAWVGREAPKQDDHYDEDDDYGFDDERGYLFVRPEPRP